MVQVAEWYCPRCKRFVASEDLTSPYVREPKHLECKTVVERRYMVVHDTGNSEEPERVE